MVYLSVIIPAYNEEERITNTLLEISEYLQKQPYEAEVIVVNDGSKDSTAEAVEKARTRIARLTVLNNEKNQGKGFSVRRGLLEARGQYRLFTDADSSTPIGEVEKLLAYLKGGYDIAIGSRSTPGARLIVRQRWYRRILGTLYGLFVHAMIGLAEIKDTQCGFKLLSSKAVTDVLPRCKVKGWSFDAEMLAVAKQLSYQIREVPIAWINHSQTKVKFLGMVRAIVDLVKVRWNLAVGAYHQP